MNRIKSIVYFGFNNPLKYKRGAENVILFQSQALNNSISKFYELSKEQKEKYTQKLINWFNDYGIIFNIEPQMHLILHAS